MKISKLVIKNFRGFTEESIEFDDITVFVGENNTGKSTILDAIKLTIGTSSWNEKLSRYDYHLKTGSSKAGDAGDIFIRIEVSEHNEDEWPDEIQQMLPDSIDIDENGLRHFFLTLKGTFNHSDERSIDRKEFQNNVEESKGTKGNNSRNFSEFRKLLPVFYISSLRDSSKEFQQKKGLFKTFLDSEVIETDKREMLEGKLTNLNNEIIDVLGNIKKLKNNLKKSMTILYGTDESIVDIEPIPSNLNDLIGKAGIILQNKTGIRLPLENHGSGAQSLSVLFLYEAFLSVLLETEYDKFSEPILLIEEPEAHLHPSAVRLFWHFIEKMPGQKIITTHSGDIISSVPFSKIRRITGNTGKNKVKSMSTISFNPKEQRFLRNYITYSRGELLFAKCWLLVEGETEHAFFEGLLNADGFLDKKGIRIVQFAQITLDVLYKISKQICMRWFIITDGDNAGQAYTQTAKDNLPESVNKDEYIYTMIEKTIEVNLMIQGYASIYENYLSSSNKSALTAKNLSGIAYFDELYDLLNSQKRSNKISKPQIILEIVDNIMQSGNHPKIETDIRNKLEVI